MHIIQVIRETNRAEIIYFLLTAYVEALWQEHTAHTIPEMALRLPIVEMQDIQSRLAAMERELGALQIARRQHDPDKLSEAINVFRCAVTRLQTLKNNGSACAKSPALCHA